jgi:hypothetical protein
MNRFHTTYAINKISGPLIVNTWDDVYEILKRLRTARSGSANSPSATKARSDPARQVHG